MLDGLAARQLRWDDVVHREGDILANDKWRVLPWYHGTLGFHHFPYVSRTAKSYFLSHACYVGSAYLMAASRQNEAVAVWPLVEPPNVLHIVIGKEQLDVLARGSTSSTSATSTSRVCYANTIPTRVSKR